MPPLRANLGGGRWRFQHGPMDVILKVEGEPEAVAAALTAAWARFEVLLTELVAELKQLRQPVDPTVEVGLTPLLGSTARQMYHACYPFASVFVTPMASVAGAVAQGLIACCQRDGVTRAWANNGGDISLHLAPGQSVQVGLVADVAQLKMNHRGDLLMDGRFEINADMPVRGIATSGWRGRSLSMGIADSVTVLAASASQADVAATLIANAVNVDDPQIQRLPASQCQDDSDLGERLVTVDVPKLPLERVSLALANGLAVAKEMQTSGLIFAAALLCQGQIRQTLKLDSSNVEVSDEPLGVLQAMRLTLA